MPMCRSRPKVTALGWLLAAEALVCVVDLSELGSNAARRRFMAAFAEALYEANKEPLHLVLDEADLWAPQRPLPDQTGLLGHIEEIVRRGRVRGFIPWLITQRPAVVHKNRAVSGRHPGRDETDGEPGPRHGRRLDRGPGRPAGRQAYLGRWTICSKLHAKRLA